MKNQIQVKIPIYYDDDMDMIVNTKIRIDNQVLSQFIGSGARLKDAVQIVTDGFTCNLQVLADGFAMAKELDGKRIYFTITISGVECSVTAQRKQKRDQLYDSVLIELLV